MKRFYFILLFSFLSIAVSAQVDRREVRAGNRKFRKDKIKEAEIDYRKAVLKDSLSVAGEYNLASSLYRQQDYEGADKALSTIKDVADSPDYHYNVGDVALQKKDYAAAVAAFRKSLLQNPGDLDAKENYIYAKKMLENQQKNGGGGGDNQQNQDQQQDQNQQQQQDNQQNQDNDKDKGRQPQPQEGISQQQAQQMLKAIQAKEKETQDKVEKEKAAAMKSRQKEKNW